MGHFLCVNWMLFVEEKEDKHVPTKTTSQRFHQPWFNVVCKKAVRKKSRRYRVYKRTKLDRDWKRYQEAAKFARKTSQNVYNTYIKENICNDKKNSKKFFSFVKSKRTDICGLSPLSGENNEIHTKEEELAEILNNQFTSVFTEDDGTTPTPLGPKGKKINDIIVTKNRVVKLLKELNPFKASGPDGIGARILKESADQVADGLFTAQYTHRKTAKSFKKT
ncbi:uncharacterized protein [Clytia hemisphaerica]|uniref:uncharacterized protein n=1 Tax=Clytia hemisphaerica TaxID=252671 RepID=UPI0034D556C3